MSGAAPPPAAVDPAPNPNARSAPRCSPWELTAYFLWLGACGFGGPVALVGAIHRDLVERRGWFSESDYKEGMTLAQLMPGPLAVQLAIYLGYVHSSVLGATVVGVAFVLPSFAIVLALGWAYRLYGGLGWMQAVFYGVGPGAIAVIAIHAVELTRSAIRRDGLLWAIYLASAGVTIATESESLWLFLGAGVLTWLAKSPRRPDQLAPAPTNEPPGAEARGRLPLAVLAAAPAAAPGTLAQLFWFFTKAGAFVFGSGLAIVPFLYGGVVKEYGWLSDEQFLDAVAVAMITPGPVVITVGFIGFLVAGFTGACVACAATFLPCYVLTVIPAPYFKRHGKHPAMVAAVDGITAAAVGAIAGAVYILGRRTLFGADGTLDLVKVVILLATLAVLLRFRRLPEQAVLLVCALAGWLLYTA